MRRYKIIAVALALFTMGWATSCSDFLEEQSPVKIPLDKALTSEEDATLFLYGGYSLIKATVFGAEYLTVTDMMTDNTDFNGTDLTRKQLSSLTCNATNKNIRIVWERLYAVVEQANVLLDNVAQNPALTSLSGKNLEAEAKFQRAWAYFQLVQLWGNVPLLTMPIYSVKYDNLKYSRAPKEQVYAQIVSDLNFSVNNLKDAPQDFTAKSGVTYAFMLKKATAKVLLAQVYMVLGQYQDVLDELAYIATPTEFNSSYSLISPYSAIYDTRYKGNPIRKNEVLWEMEAQATSAFNNGLHREMAPSDITNGADKDLDKPVGLTTGYQNMIPTYDLLKSFNQSDWRYLQMYQFSKAAPSSIPQIMKGYDVLATDQNLGGPAVVLLRIADAYLMIAEAYNELGVPNVAKPFVDLVRLRAGLNPLPQDLTEAQMRDSIMLERRHEFAHEGGYRLFDLRRTGAYKSVMESYHANQAILLTAEPVLKAHFISPASPTHKALDINIPFIAANKTWQDKYWLHPIPSDERAANSNISQNPGWN